MKSRAIGAGKLLHWMTAMDDRLTLLGRPCHLTKLADGTRELHADDGGELTEPEWQAYCLWLRGLARHKAEARTARKAEFKRSLLAKVRRHLRARDGEGQEHGDGGLRVSEPTPVSFNDFVNALRAGTHYIGLPPSVLSCSRCGRPEAVDGLRIPLRKVGTELLCPGCYRPLANRRPSKRKL